jgi:N-acetylated-alpha-linked acidic dipeptidase
MRAVVLSLVAVSTLAMTPFTADNDTIRGFTIDSSKVERDWESKFKSIPEPSRMRESMRRLSAHPHHVGSSYDKANAEWIRDQFRSYGWEANIENFDVLFPTPNERVVEMVSPTVFKADLNEKKLSVDPTSGQQDEQLPPYVAYSHDGDVTGPLVFVNYGIPSDYDELERHGISVKGAIVIAKYADRGVASSRKSQRSTARSAASSTPIQGTMATRSEMSSRKVQCAHRRECSADPSQTCRRIPAIQ